MKVKLVKGYGILNKIGVYGRITEAYGEGYSLNSLTKDGREIPNELQVGCRFEVKDLCTDCTEESTTSEVKKIISIKKTKQRMTVVFLTADGYIFKLDIIRSVKNEIL